MLAQNFKTAEELGINETEKNALESVLRMMERGEIVYHEVPCVFDHGRWRDKPKYFNMKQPCGSVCCILGWARDIGGEKSFEGYSTLPELSRLFGMGQSLELVNALGGSGRKYSDVTVEEAATALRSYLTTGKPNWAEAVNRRE